MQKQILQAFLRPFHLVEVEYGHPMSIGKVTGEVKSNKRYPESFQLGSMPKRRLAIVLKATQRKATGLVQVVPISSVQPSGHDQSCVEVTDMIAPFGFSSYKKQCWAICGMVEHVSATRIFAPEIDFGGRKHPPSFKAVLKGEDKKSIQRALVHGVEAQAVVEEKNDQIALRDKQIIELQKQLEQLQMQLKTAEIHEAIAREYSEILEDNFEDAVARRIMSEMACSVSDA
ncbi:type II toxin-antitoxin system PemK/MazF family toxin [Paludibacterium denitrificans]|uniref:type II toxin-antitoxin system PemK/MazF family toxin n=1 Tax=Paludibacterium denitrificans TaxID=2675226 RepID=UPI001E373D02|nr:type II toxin-antitoxin system PemK/MazF family toxin [Paludibacterium denitrificans]